MSYYKHVHDFKDQILILALAEIFSFYTICTIARYNMFSIWTLKCWQLFCTDLNQFNFKFVPTAQENEELEPGPDGHLISTQERMQNIQISREEAPPVQQEGNTAHILSRGTTASRGYTRAASYLGAL